MKKSFAETQRMDMYANIWLKILVRLAMNYVDFSDDVTYSINAHQIKRKKKTP
jgi:hypothetical protein